MYVKSPRGSHLEDHIVVKLQAGSEPECLSSFLG